MDDKKIEKKEINQTLWCYNCNAVVEPSWNYCVNCGWQLVHYINREAFRS